MRESNPPVILLAREATTPSSPMAHKRCRREGDDPPTAPLFLHMAGQLKKKERLIGEYNQLAGAVGLEPTYS